MATIPPQEIVKEGLVPGYVAADALGDEFFNNGLYILAVKNKGVVQEGVTIADQKECDQGHNHPLPVVLIAGEVTFISNLARERFNDVNGHAHITYTDATNLEVAVLKII